MEQESWKDIPGYEGSYQASDLGRIKSLARVVPWERKGSRYRSGMLTIKEKILSTNKAVGQYHAHHLIHPGVKSRNRKAHILIAMTFLGPQPTPKHQVNHKDGNKLNNHVSNLEWVTPKENMQHAHKTGLVSFYHRGESHAASKLKEKDIKEIKRLFHEEGVFQKDIAKLFNVSKCLIGNIITNRTWKHVACALILCLFFGSCTVEKRAQIHIRKAKEHLEKATTLDPTLRLTEPDTAWVEVPIPQVETSVKFIPIKGDTVVINKDRLQIKYVKLAGDTVWIEGKCLPDTISVAVPFEKPIYIAQESYKSIVKRIFGLNNFQFWLLHIILLIFLVAFVANKISGFSPLGFIKNLFK